MQFSIADYSLTDLLTAPVDVFDTYTPSFKVYELYATNFQNALDTINTCKKEKDFLAFLSYVASPQHTLTHLPRALTIIQSYTCNPHRVAGTA